jgi:hypothetical protein
LWRRPIEASVRNGRADDSSPDEPPSVFERRPASAGPDRLCFADQDELRQCCA